MKNNRRLHNNHPRFRGLSRGPLTALFCRPGAISSRFGLPPSSNRLLQPTFSQPGWDFLAPLNSAPSSSAPLTYLRTYDPKNRQKSWDFRPFPLFLGTEPLRPQRSLVLPPCLANGPERAPHHCIVATLPARSASGHGLAFRCTASPSTGIRDGTESGPSSVAWASLAEHRPRAPSASALGFHEHKLASAHGQACPWSFTTALISYGVLTNRPHRRINSLVTSSVRQREKDEVRMLAFLTHILASPRSYGETRP